MTQSFNGILQRIGQNDPSLTVVDFPGGIFSLHNAISLSQALESNSSVCVLNFDGSIVEPDAKAIIEQAAMDNRSVIAVVYEEGQEISSDLKEKFFLRRARVEGLATQLLENPRDLSDDQIQDLACREAPVRHTLANRGTSPEVINGLFDGVDKIAEQRGLRISKRADASHLDGESVSERSIKVKTIAAQLLDDPDGLSDQQMEDLVRLEDQIKYQLRQRHDLETTHVNDLVNYAKNIATDRGISWDKNGHEPSGKGDASTIVTTQLTLFEGKQAPAPERS